MFYLVLDCSLLNSVRLNCCFVLNRQGELSTYRATLHRIACFDAYSLPHEWLEICCLHVATLSQ